MQLYYSSYTYYFCQLIKENFMDQYSYISNAHVAYLDELYKSYKEDPNSVDPEWQRFFQGYEFSLQKYGDPGEEIELRISATKSNGDDINGFFEIRDGVDFDGTIENGVATEYFSMPENTESGTYSLNIHKTPRSSY